MTGAASRPVLTSTANPRVKALLGLRRRRDREAAGWTVVDGHDELSVALDAGVRPVAVWVCPALWRDAAQAALLDRAAGAQVVEASRQVFERASYREGPDGWLAVVPAAGGRLADLRLGADPLVLVAEAVEKPGNLGAMLRTADATGVDAVLAAAPGTDWGNPNVVRASKGAVFAVPVAAAGGDEVLAWLAGRGLRLVAATPGATLAHVDADLTGPVAVAVGAEDRGLSGGWLAAADVRVRIPMTGRVNSLNVATSAAVLLYEAVRQRRRPADQP